MVKERCQFDSGLASTNQAVFDKSCQYVYVACEDASIKVYNLLTQESETPLKGHEDAVLDLCFDPGRDGYLISASSDCSFRIWQ
jgi:WD40 repeat protein